MMTLKRLYLKYIGGNLFGRENTFKYYYLDIYISLRYISFRYSAIGANYERK